VNRAKLLELFTKMGFSQTEFEVYLLLSVKGKLKAKEIAERLNITTAYAYRILTHLHQKGTVVLTRDRGFCFSAKSIDRVISVQIVDNQRKAEEIQRSKARILFEWQRFFGNVRNRRSEKY
jgi:sugar-specific transcriptional regulator TrmB